MITAKLWALTRAYFEVFQRHIFRGWNYFNIGYFYAIIRIKLSM